MSIDELMQKVLTILPNATFEDDGHGQVVIYTDMQVGARGELEPLEVENHGPEEVVQSVSGE